jgi:hypothetical protein
MLPHARAGLVWPFEQLVGTISFLWGPEKSLQRLLFVLQLVVGGVASYWLIVHVMGRGADRKWIYPVLGFCVSTVVLASVLSIFMVWIALLSLKVISGVYFTSIYKGLEAAVHSFLEKMLRLE